MNTKIRTRRITRSSDVIDTREADGNLIRVLKPGRVSLVERPANQRGFSVLRSDTTATAKPKPAPTPKVPATRRVRRTDNASPVLAVTFPEGTTEDSAQASLVEFGMDGYRLENKDGVIRAFRSDLQSIAPETSVDVPLGAGVVATVTRTAGMAPTSLTPDTPCISLAGVTFPESFSDEDAAAWLQRNDIDAAADTQDGKIHIQRMEVAEGEETRSIQMDDGVVLTLTRSVYTDVPAALVAVVDEWAYGSWGWGQLDFAAAMADAEYSDKSRMGMNKLDDVLRQILYYSNLPLDVRKGLVQNALTQFGTFLSELMDNLPRGLLVSVVRSDNATFLEKENMSTSAGAKPTPAATTSGESVTLSRSELQQLVGEAVATGIQRHDEAKAKAQADAEAAAAAEAEKAETLRRSDLTAVLGDALKPLTDRMDALEGKTVVRSVQGDSNPADAEAAAAAAEAAAVKRAADMKSGNIFRGVLGITDPAKAKS